MRPVSALSALAALGALAYAGAAWIAPEPAGAEETAAYPEHIQMEMQEQLLQSQVEVQKLRQELDDIRDSAISSRIKKFKELQELLETDMQIRTLLREDPSLYPLYKASIGDDVPGSMTASDIFPDYSEGDSRSQFCGCLASTRVKWIGKGPQAGKAVLSVSGNDMDLEVGQKLGNTLCYLHHTTPKQATIKCRDPIQDRGHLKHLAYQIMPR